MVNPMNVRFFQRTLLIFCILFSLPAEIYSAEPVKKSSMPVDISADFSYAKTFNDKVPLAFSTGATFHPVWFADAKVAMKIDSASFNILLLGKFTPVDMNRFALQLDIRFHYADIYPYNAHDIGGMLITSFLISSRKHPANRFTFELALGWKIADSISSYGSGSESFFKYMPLFKAGFNMRFLRVWKLSLDITSFDDCEYRPATSPAFVFTLGYRINKFSYVEIKGNATYTDGFYLSGTLGGWGISALYTHYIHPSDKTKEVYK